MKKITTPEMEVILAHHFKPQVNLVVPNVSWGFLNHEADLLVMTKAGYLYEVEIKISISDLKADAKKRHCHESNKIKYLYFAIPKHMLEKGLPHIPERAGILVVGEKSWKVTEHRAPVKNCSYKISNSDRYQIARLGALRIWGLKGGVISSRNSANHLREWIKARGLWPQYSKGELI